MLGGAAAFQLFKVGLKAEWGRVVKIGDSIMLSDILEFVLHKPRLDASAPLRRSGAEA